MATKRLTMSKTKEILRHKWVLGRSHREVAQSLGISAGMVGTTLARAKKAGLTQYDQLAALDDAAIEERLYPRKLETSRPRPQAVMRGVPIRIVQEWLGHASIEMTMRYAHLVEGIGHDLIDRLAPDKTAPEARSTIGAHDPDEDPETPPNLH